MPDTASSLARPFFLGEIHEDLAFPYPHLSHEERAKVDALVKDARRFIDEHYDARQAEADGWVGDDVIAGLGERGLLGLYVPEKYGGQGLSPSAFLLAVALPRAVKGKVPGYAVPMIAVYVYFIVGNLIALPFRGFLSKPSK